jgi:hypothetical protein
LFRAQGVFANNIGQNTWTLQRFSMTSLHHYCQQHRQDKHQIIFVTGVNETLMGHNNKKMEMRHQGLMKKLFMKIT